jgi:hypothetical protein
MAKESDYQDKVLREIIEARRAVHDMKHQGENYHEGLHSAVRASTSYQKAGDMYLKQARVLEDERQVIGTMNKAIQNYTDARNVLLDYESGLRSGKMIKRSEMPDISPLRVRRESLNETIKKATLAREKVELRWRKGGRQADLESYLNGTSYLKGTLALLSIFSLVGSLFFISLNLTGGVIGVQENNNPISIGLFIAGLIFALFYFRQKYRGK